MMKKTILFLFLLTLTLLSCQQQKGTAHSDDRYTCPMHPQVVQNEPGTCPICHMDLVKVAKKAERQLSTSIQLSEDQIRLANIRIDTLGVGEQSRQTWLTGTLAVNPKLKETVSSRSAGRIERLYVRQNGETIRKGAPLLDVYSEQLQTLQNEYLLALAQKRELGDPGQRYSRLVEAAGQKLLLLGLTEGQLKQLAVSGKARPIITFLSPATGVVQDVAVTEGQYLSEGTRLLSLADLSTLWVEAQLYPSEVARVSVGTAVEVQVAGQRESNRGQVVFLNPELQANSRVVLTRIELANPGGRLLPGMQANVRLTNTQTQALFLPLEAVLRDSKGAYVWKQTGAGTFEVAMVTTGTENSRTIEITAGLNRGDRVVVSGAYLLHSEYKLRQGADPMAGHEHSKTEM
jgi:membrane fusion protein, copper/silver efflux system